MTYRVTLRHSLEGYSVSCPELPRCHSQAKTRAEAIINIKSAIREYLLAKRELAECS
jgi:predicted RNase H-like HicB family nuclease